MVKTNTWSIGEYEVFDDGEKASIVTDRGKVKLKGSDYYEFHNGIDYVMESGGSVIGFLNSYLKERGWKI